MDYTLLPILPAPIDLQRLQQYPIMPMRIVAQLIWRSGFQSKVSAVKWDEALLACFAD